jgi:hypothetical protein
MTAPPPPPRLHPRPHLRLVSSSRGRTGPRDGDAGGLDADDPGRSAGDRDKDGGGGPVGGRGDGPTLATRAPGPVPRRPDEAWQVIDAHDDEDEDEGEDGDPAPARAPQPRLLVALLIGLQAMAALAYGAKYAELARAGGVYGLATALALPSAIALYAGAVLLLARPGRGRALFFVAAVGLGLSIPAWGVDASWTWPVAAGAMLALAGAWYARAEVHVAEEAEAQP